ncbi:nuclease-related domain-containing protein [Myxococcus sp. CA040A]|uniref:nuclease-related domain-containing protein n=1 Tax=Myxococcus sp. CA040A TaxID=2741738 RepID=UPI00157A3071|nr:nuclease-related domain-containing protein [Myxococcus sp. CA040A]NTX07040.1 NERD domain-containing protein [Myxococcus sp. CA040A]
MFFKKREEQAAASAGRTGRRAGQSAREKQQELANAAPIKTFFTRLLNIHTDERAWRLGADGEERVGDSLDQLRSAGWHVEHDVKVGARGANVDHLVIGPPGVFVINTKAVRGKVWVAGPNLHVNRRPTNFVEKQEDEAQRVRQCLVEATRRRSLWVQGLIVFVNQSPVVKEAPRHVAVLHISDLLPGLLSQPMKLGADDLEDLMRAARSDATWAK